MASLRRKPNSKFWIACFKAADGRYLQRSTKTTDKRLAMKLANEFERTSAARMTEVQARRVISDIHQMVTGDQLKFPSVRDYLSQWLESRKGTVADTTYDAYDGVARAFVEFLGKRATIQISHIGTADIVGFRDHLKELSAIGTANNKLKILRVAFKQAWRDGILEDDPAAKVPILKASPDDDVKRRAFTVEELQKLLAAADVEWTGLILFGLYTGQRLGDIARLTWGNIDLEKGVITFKTRKTRRRQILPIAPPLRKWIESQKNRDSGMPVFPSSKEIIDRAGKVSTLSRHFYELMAEVGLVPKRTHGKKAAGVGAKRNTKSSLTFHSLRHTATSMMKNAGISPAIVQEFVGHDSKVVSDNYTHIEFATLLEASKSMPDVVEERS